MDFELGHTFTSSHQFKPQSLITLEHHKRSKKLSAYHDADLAFDPLVSNSLGLLVLDFLRFLWGLADYVARNQVPVHSETNACVRFTAPFGLDMFAANVRIARTNQLCAPFAGHISTRVWAGPVDH